MALSWAEQAASTLDKMALSSAATLRVDSSETEKYLDCSSRDRVFTWEVRVRGQGARIRSERARVRV